MRANKTYVSIPINEAALRERRGDLLLLLEIGSLLSTCRNIGTFLTSALSKLLGYFGIRAGRIYLLDEKEEFLWLAAHMGMEPGGLEQVQINEGFSGRAVRTKSFLAQRVSDLEDEDRRRLLLGKGFEIVICVPLIAMDKVVGVMNFATGGDFELSGETIDLLSAIGNQIAIAVNQERLYEELNLKINELKKKQEIVQFFVYSISHDLKSPAMSIYTLSKRLMEKYAGCIEEKGAEHCEQIQKAAGQLLELVDKINGYICAKEVPFQFEVVNLELILQSIICEFQPMLGKRKITQEGTLSLPSIVGDRIALTRVFRNLVDNALKYGGPAMSLLKVAYKEDDEYHILSFCDDGAGISVMDQQRIFEVFQRRDTARGIAGSGLGLAIVREVAAGHKGRAWLVSNQGHGATFFISISKGLRPGAQETSERAIESGPVR
jgi:signal transduction histidine kinase